MEKIYKMPKKSFYTKKIAKGCKICQKGAKLVLLITGLCPSKCFYCPLSEKKKGKDVIYANEKLVEKKEDIIEEAELINAEGAGITGGDPLIVLDKTIDAIKMLKDYFGSEFHIHLYTSMFDVEKVKEVEKSGLDEIRFHPSIAYWRNIDKTNLGEVIKNCGIDKGIEIPLIPHLKDDTFKLIEDLEKYEIDFINLNELEFSVTNVEELSKYGYVTKNDISSAVKGSEEMAYELIEKDFPIPLHYCSSSFKDAIQLRRRIQRRARNVAKIYEIITDDGTLLKGVVIADKNKVDEIREKFEIDEKLIIWDEEKRRIETSPFILEEIADYLPYKCYIVEEYPTADRLEVEVTPLN